VITTGTRQKKYALDRAEVEAAHELARAKIHAEAEARHDRLAAQLADQPPLQDVHTAELARRKASADLELETGNRQLAQRLTELDGEVRAVVEKAKAVSPDLIAALQAFGDRALAEKMAQSMAPLAILGGESVAEVLARLLRGTKLAQVLGGEAAVELDGE